jgi:NifU-like protein involved in Fe-S cluster formation
MAQAAILMIFEKSSKTRVRLLSSPAILSIEASFGCLPNSDADLPMTSRFSETLMDHFQSPRNQGRMDSPAAAGVAGVPGQGRFLIIYLRVHDGRVTEATFEAHGCGVSIACGSALTELITGRTPEECGALTPQHLIDALGGIPADKHDRAGFALHALRDALQNLNVSESASTWAMPASPSSDTMIDKASVEVLRQDPTTARAADDTAQQYPGCAANLPFCHSRRGLPGETTTFFCAHPQVFSNGQRVSAQVCRMCDYWKQPPPSQFRPFDPAAAILRTRPCRFLGEQSGWRQCPTCRGNVRIKVFDCRHPSHDTTTLDECKVCPDFANIEGADAP